jgi:hypothetical protein
MNKLLDVFLYFDSIYGFWNSLQLLPGCYVKWALFSLQLKIIIDIEMENLFKTHHIT